MVKKLCKSVNPFPLLLLALGLLLGACIKDHFDTGKITGVELKPSLAFPIGSVEMNLNKLLQNLNAIYIQDPDTELVTLIYELQNLLSQTAEQIISIPNQHFGFPRFISYIPPLPGEVFTYEYGTSRSFIPDDESQRLDTLVFKEGKLRILYAYDIEHESRTRITSPSLIHTLTGETFDLLTNLNYNSGGIGITETEVELNDYYLVFTHEEDEKNFVSFDFILEIEGDENAEAREYFFDSDIFLEDILFRKMMGYLGQYSLLMRDTLFFDVFDDVLSGSLQLGNESANIELFIRNSYGIPIELDINPFAAVSTVNSPYEVDIYLFGYGNSNTFSILSPNIDQLGQTVSTHIVTQSNAAEAINMKPEYIYFSVLGLTNPDINTNEVNFVLDSSLYSLDLITKFDLYGSLNKLTLQDTLEYDFEFPAEMESAEIKIAITNDFPLEVDLQIYLTDVNYLLLDSLITDQKPLIPGAQTGPPPEYQLANPGESVHKIPLSKEKVAIISESDYIVLKGELNTSNSEPAKLYGYYNLKVDLALIINTHITLPIESDGKRFY